MEIIPKEKADIKWNEDYDRNRRWFELNYFGGLSADKISKDPKENPKDLTANSIGRVIKSFRKRHTRNGGDKN